MWLTKEFMQNITVFRLWHHADQQIGSLKVSLSDSRIFVLRKFVAVFIFSLFLLDLMHSECAKYSLMFRKYCFCAWCGLLKYKYIMTLWLKHVTSTQIYFETGLSSLLLTWDGRSVSVWRTFLTIHPLFNNELWSTSIKLTYQKELSRSVMTYACPT
jgi:hypothetical protein